MSATTTEMDSIIYLKKIKKKDGERNGIGIEKERWK